MKKFNILSCFLLCCFVICAVCPSLSASALSEPEISSRAAVVMDRNSGQVYFSKNADQLIYPASTTKIMTVLLAVEAIEAGTVSIYDNVTAQSSMSYDLVSDGSSAGIVVGETLTLEQLLYCAMVSSANEACNIIAEYISGSIPDFIELMNARAAELGCTYTHFDNTHGLPDEDHYSTASDFCLIAAEAASHDLFMEICDTSSITLEATNMSEARQLNNSNALICSDSMYGSGYLYEYASGIKTGYTSDAGYCLVSTASRDGIDLLAVVFGGQSTTNEDGTTGYSNFSDTITLYEWVFNNFSYQEILSSVELVAEAPVSLGSDADSVSLRPESSISALLPNDFSADDMEREITIYSEVNGEELSAPIEAGEVLGEISVKIDGVSYGTVKLVSSSAVELSHLQYLRTQISETVSSAGFKIAVLVILVLVIAYIVLVARYRAKHRRRRAAQAARRKSAAAGEATRQSASVREPKISYFSAAENETSAAPAASEASRQTARDSGTRTADAEKADRDYFEEFFRKK